MPLAIIEKSPRAALTYTINWTPWLPTGDQLDTVVWTVPAGLTKVSESNTGYKASIKLSGGTAGQVYDVVCEVTTVGANTDARTLQFSMVAR